MYWHLATPYNLREFGNYRHPGPRRVWLGLRAALLDTTSPAAVAAVAAVATAAVFQKSPISCYLSYLRARDLSKIDLFMKFDVFGVRNYEIGV